MKFWCTIVHLKRQEYTIGKIEEVAYQAVAQICGEVQYKPTRHTPS